MGYLTLFVLRFLSSPPNDNPKLELSALKHADIYDEDTRATTSYLQSCFPQASMRKITFPKEQASDFTLLAAYAGAYASSTFDLPNEVLSQFRTDVLSYVELLERLAATLTNPNLEDLLATSADLRLARRTCF